jgi:tripartite-type tricarboxylate transporter receptor subunit TctC
MENNPEEVVPAMAISSRRGSLGAMCRLGLVLAAGAGYRAAVAQQAFPARPVRLVVPFAAGGPTDVIARVLAEILGARWGQPVVVENRGGGGTIVGTAAVAQAAPDGHTLGIATNAFVVNPGLRRNLPYDTRRDFVAIGMLITTPMVLVASNEFPATTLANVVAQAAQAHQPLTYTSPGPGTVGQMAGALLQHEAAITLEHIPYSGSAPALTDVLAGRVPLMFDLWSSVRPHVEAGRLKLIAVCGEQRLPELPQVPTVAETYPGFSAVAFQAVFAPAGVPVPLLEQLSADIRAVVSSPGFEERVMQLGVRPTPMSRMELEAFFEREMAKWRDVARAAHISLD